MWEHVESTPGGMEDAQPQLPMVPSPHQDGLTPGPGIPEGLGLRGETFPGPD